MKEDQQHQHRLALNGLREGDVNGNSPVTTAGKVLVSAAWTLGYRQALLIAMVSNSSVGTLWRLDDTASLRRNHPFRQRIGSALRVRQGLSAFVLARVRVPLSIQWTDATTRPLLHDVLLRQPDVAVTGELL